MNSPIDSAEDRHLQHVDLDPYILDKHLNGLSSRSGNLLETDCDPSVNELFDESKSAYGWYEDDFDPRSIRPPPFSQHMKQVRDARMKLKETPRRSARIPVRTTKAERLKLARQRSISESNSSMPYLNPLNKSRQSKISPRTPNRQQPMPSMSRLSPLQMLKNNGYRHAESAQSCKDALDSKGPLLLSSMLIKQMRQDIKNNRGKSFDTEAISSILLFPFSSSLFETIKQCASSRTSSSSMFSSISNETCSTLVGKSHSNGLYRIQRICVSGQCHWNEFQ